MYGNSRVKSYTRLHASAVLPSDAQASREQLAAHAAVILRPEGAAQQPCTTAAAPQPKVLTHHGLSEDIVGTHHLPGRGAERWVSEGGMGQAGIQREPMTRSQLTCKITRQLTR